MVDLFLVYFWEISTLTSTVAGVICHLISHIKVPLRPFQHLSLFLMTAVLTGWENLSVTLRLSGVSKPNVFHVYCPLVCLLLRTVFGSFLLSMLFDFFSSFELLVCCRYQSIFCPLAMFSSCSVNRLMSWLAVPTTQERFDSMRRLLFMVGLISRAVELLFGKPLSTWTFDRSGLIIF